MSEKCQHIFFSCGSLISVTPECDDFWHQNDSELAANGITVMSFKEEIVHSVKLEEEDGDPLTHITW